MRTTLETVTPEHARNLLNKNTRNRRENPRKIDAIARDITAGRWHVHHQGIAIAPGFVVDGQNRLHAIIQSELSVRVNITEYETDVEGEAALMVVDRNQPRSDADVQVIAGVMDKEIARAAVSILKLLVGHSIVSTYKRLTEDELSDLYRAERDHIDWAIRALNDAEAPRRFNAVHRTAFAVGHMVDPACVERLAAEVVAADESRGAVACAWGKAAEQNRFNRTTPREALVLALRLIQAELLGEKPPAILRGSGQLIGWFREHIAKRRLELAQQQIAAA